MNHIEHKSKGCRIHLIGGECVECYQDYYLTHNNVCKICPPSFFENFKESISIVIVLILVQMQNVRSSVMNVIPGSKNPLMFKVIMAVLMTMCYQLLNKVVLKNFKFYAF